MPRPQRCRRICSLPAVSVFSPVGNEETIKNADSNVILSLDEYEAIRLMDHQGKTHEQCAKIMDISRTTVTEIYESARRKIARSLVEGKTLVISGGNCRLCRENDSCKGQTPCCHKQFTYIKEKEKQMRRVAVTYENGEIFQHFGRTPQFKIYDLQDDGTISDSIVAETNGQGHGALAGFLQYYQVDTLICGGIGGGAQAALAQMGITLYGGVSGNADEAVKALADGTLSFVEDIHCEHHDHEHGEGHTCGEHGCGGHHHEESEEHHCCGGHHEESEEHHCCGGHHEENEGHHCCH